MQLKQYFLRVKLWALRGILMGRCHTRKNHHSVGKKKKNVVGAQDSPGHLARFVQN